MNSVYTHEHLEKLGFRIESSGDLALARQIVDTVGEKRVTMIAHELTSRRRPPPERVAKALGLAQLRTLPFGASFQRVSFERAASHIANRANGWPARHTPPAISPSVD